MVNGEGGMGNYKIMRVMNQLRFRKSFVACNI